MDEDQINSLIQIYHQYLILPFWRNEEDYDTMANNSSLQLFIEKVNQQKQFCKQVIKQSIDILEQMKTWQQVYHQKLQYLGQKLEEKELQIKSLNDKICKMNEKICQYQQKIIDLQSQEQKNEDSIQNLILKINLKDKEISEFKKQFKGLLENSNETSYINTLYQKIEYLQNQIEEFQKQNRQYQLQNIKYQEEHIISIQIINQLRQKLRIQFENKNKLLNDLKSKQIYNIDTQQSIHDRSYDYFQSGDNKNQIQSKVEEINQSVYNLKQDFNIKETSEWNFKKSHDSNSESQIKQVQNKQSQKNYQRHLNNQRSVQKLRKVSSNVQLFTFNQYFSTVESINSPENQDPKILGHNKKKPNNIHYEQRQKNQKYVDPYFIYYQLTCQSVKMEKDEEQCLGYLQVDLKPFFQEVMTKIPFSKWRKWIQEKVELIYQQIYDVYGGEYDIKKK